MGAESLVGALRLEILDAMESALDVS